MKYVTICREYCAHGNSIGRAAAKELGVEFYDRDIIRATAKETDSDYETIKSEGETITLAEKFVRHITPISYDQKEHLFDVQRQVILNLAEQGPCFFLGRCADVILTEAGYNPLRIFVYGDDIYRAGRLAEYMHSQDMAEVTRTLRKGDQARRSYYEHFSHQDWGDIRNFDLVLNSGTLGFDECVKIIVEAAKEEK